MRLTLVYQLVCAKILSSKQMTALYIIHPLHKVKDHLLQQVANAIIKKYILIASIIKFSEECLREGRRKDGTMRLPGIHHHFHLFVVFLSFCYALRMWMVTSETLYISFVCKIH